jgi:uncharacterized membrane protein YobD (UPF0266 family)
MKYILTEDQLEKLLKASLKRHSKDPESNITSGMFNFDGFIVKYSVSIRGDGYVYANYTYQGQRFKVHIMSEENFIQLDKKEQENSVEFRIKKDIEKKSK